MMKFSIFAQSAAKLICSEKKQSDERRRATNANGRNAATAGSRKDRMDAEGQTVLSVVLETVVGFGFHRLAPFSASKMA